MKRYFLEYGLIRLRAIEPSDADMMLCAESDVSAWPDSDICAPYSMEMLKNYASSYSADPFGEGQLRMIVEDSRSGTAIGILDLYDISAVHRHAMVGIYILPDFRNKGFAKASVSAASKYAFRRLNLHALGAKILRSNTISSHLFESCGYTVAGILPSWHFADGRFHDMAVLTVILEN